MKIIILLGVPGSGKGTQAEKIAERYGWAHISTGELLRALASDPKAVLEDKRLLSAMPAGKLVADKLIYKLVFREIEKCLIAGQGVVLDGAVRTIAQASAYQKFFVDKGVANEVIAIEIALSDDDSRKRLLYRQEQTGDQRSDDHPATIEQRIREQGNAALRPIVDYYNKLGLLRRVSGSESIESVTKNIQKILE